MSFALNQIRYSVEEIRSLRFERQLDVICDSFEASWKSGNLPDLREFSQLASPQYQQRILRELILIERECAIYHGNRISNHKEVDFDTMNHSAKETREPARRRVASDELPTHVDKFAILGLLGRGTHGIVYEAEDVRTRRRVALKVANFDASGQTIKSFEQEASNTLKIVHSSIVQIWEVNEIHGVPYMASELVRGTDLRSIITAQRLSDRTAVTIVADIAEGISAAHASGIIHRDLKPSNIIIEGYELTQTGSGQPETIDPFEYDINKHKVRIIDFGIAKMFDRTIALTLAGDIIGTPHYMSPEQARGDSHAVDARSDTFSLGVMLFELLTGKLPFPGEAVVAISAIRDKAAPNPKSYRNDLPFDLEQIISKCLKRDPKERYQTAKELASDLREWLSRGSVASLQRHRIRKRVTLAGSLLSLGLIAVSSYQGLESLIPAKNSEVLGVSALFGQKLESKHPTLARWIHSGNPDHLLNWLEVATGKPDMLATSLQELNLDKEASADQKWRFDFAQVLIAGDSELKRKPSFARQIYHAIEFDTTSSWARVLELSGDQTQMDFMALFNVDRTSKSRLAALRVLSEVFSRQNKYEVLFQLLRKCRVDELSMVLRAIKPESESVSRILAEEFTYFESQLLSQAMFDSNESAQWCARLGLVAMEIGDYDRVERILGFTRDPRARTQFIMSFHPAGLSLMELVSRLDRYSDDWKSTAILSCLANVSPESLSRESRKQCIDMLFEAFESHPSAGVHTATKTILTNWGFQERINERNSSQEFRTIKPDRNWYINSQGMQMCIVRGPTEFWVGFAPQSKELPNYSARWKDRQRSGLSRLDYSFAISSEPITKVDLFEQCQSIGVMKAIDKYTADRYCDWLSLQEKLSDEERYELPSLEEWECAVRSGTANDYGFIPHPGTFDDNRLSESVLFNPNGVLIDGSAQIFEWTRTSFDDWSGTTKHAFVIKQSKFYGYSYMQGAFNVAKPDSNLTNAFRYARRISP